MYFRVGLKNWRSLKSSLEMYIEETFQTYRTDSLTQQIFDRVTPQISSLLRGQNVASDIRPRTQASTVMGNQIAFAGEKDIVERIKGQLIQMIRRFESEIQEEQSVTRSTVPNISEYQIRYFDLIKFFSSMIHKHKLKSFRGNVGSMNVTMEGTPTSVDAAQRDMFGLITKVNESKASVTKKPIFLRIFKTGKAEQVIKEKLNKKQLYAVWCLENKTISVYSDSKAISQQALDCITDTIWEAQYPPSKDLDELEIKLLNSGLWMKKKEELIQLYSPLEICQLGDRAGLSLAGLDDTQNNVLEEIPYFFAQHVKRTMPFTGFGDRIRFLSKFRGEIFRDLERDHEVKIVQTNQNTAVEITGTKDEIANCSRALKKVHDAIYKDVHRIEHEAMIQYIQRDIEFLETVGLKTRCLVVPHKEDVVQQLEVESESSPRTHPIAVGSRYSVTLPSGAVCEVCKGDVPAMDCDAIVNAANGDLQHVGGLALAIVKIGKIITNVFNRF